jgi:hypothetical protein
MPEELTQEQSTEQLESSAEGEAPEADAAIDSDEEESEEED